MMSSPRKAPLIHLPRVPDYSDDRRSTILSMLGEASAASSWAKLSSGAKITYVVGALVCDDTGFLAAQDLEAAMGDIRAVGYAYELLVEAGAQ